MGRYGLRLLLACTAAIALIAGGVPSGRGAQPTAASSKPVYLVILVLDGARPNYFNVTNLPHLTALIHRGTQYDNAFASILESETPSGHATIATGSEPARSGVPSFGWINNRRQVVNLFNPTRIRGGAMDRLIRAAGVPTIAGLIHQQLPGGTVAALSGYKYYAADALGGPDADATMYYAGRPGGYGPVAIPGHLPPQTVLDGPKLTMPNSKLPLALGDHLAMRLASRTFRVMRPRAMMINLPEFDWPLGHVYGGGRDWKDVTTLMRGFDRDLGMLEKTYKKAGVLKHTIFVITADHGFSPIYHRVSKTIFTNAATAAGTGLIWTSYHTGTYLWLQDQSKTASVAANVVAAHNPYIQSVYYRVTGKNGAHFVRAGGSGLRVAGQGAANQYLLGTFNGPNAPDIVALCTENAAVVGNGQATWKGDHGGADWQSQQVPLVIAGYGVRSHYVAHFPARLEDVAPTVLTLMGVTPNGMEGSPLADAMLAPPSWASAAQTKLGKQLWPLVMSMQAESAAETAKKH